MRYAKSIIALVILTSPLSMVMVSQVNAVSVVEIDPSIMIDATGNNTTADLGIMDTLSKLFTDTIQIIIEIILTPFRAIASIWMA
jgi:hypothetical protein